MTKDELIKALEKYPGNMEIRYDYDDGYDEFEIKDVRLFEDDVESVILLS